MLSFVHTLHRLKPLSDEGFERWMPKNLHCTKCYISSQLTSVDEKQTPKGPSSCGDLTMHRHVVSVAIIIWLTPIFWSFVHCSTTCRRSTFCHSWRGREARTCSIISSLPFQKGKYGPVKSSCRFSSDSHSIGWKSSSYALEFLQKRTWLQRHSSGLSVASSHSFKRAM